MNVDVSNEIVLERPVRKLQFWRYGSAVLGILLAVIVRELFDPYLGDQLPFFTLFLAVTYISWRVGFGPALFTVIAGYFALFYLFIPPRHTFLISALPGWAHTIAFFIAGLAMAWLVQKQRSAQIEAQRHEQQYRSLFDRTPVMMHSIDLNGKLLSVSQYWLESLGYERSEVLGRESIEFMTPESRKLAEQVVLPEFFRTGMCKDINYQFVKKNGEIIDVLLSAICEKDSEGKLVRSLAVLTDVSAQKRAEEQIRLWSFDLEKCVRQRTEELEAFCYSVSHDLRGPVRRIASFSELLRDDSENLSPEERKEMLQIVIQSATRMDQLIHDLLTLSRLSHCDMQCQSTDLSALVEKVAIATRKNDPQREVEFIIRPDLVVLGDERTLEIALENLIANAWKFSRNRTPARIEFGVEEMDGCPVYFLRDNGIGFDMAYASKLFGVFERLHSDAEFPGTGIGLAIVKRVINRQGGEIWVKAAPNQGATFYFTLHNQTKPACN
jgi:PAS domain S-box-containing protein